MLGVELSLRLVACVNAGRLRPLFTAVVADEEVCRRDRNRHHALREGLSFTATGSPPGFEFCTTGTISSQGLNDEEIPRPKASGERRVLVIGDSFVEALQVPRKDNFCELLEAKLSREHGHRIRVINAGVGSYSPLIEYVYLKQRLADLEPDIVILMLSPNDIFNDLTYLPVVQSDQQHRPVAVGPGGARILIRTAPGRAEAIAERQRAEEVMRRPSWAARQSYLVALVAHVHHSRRLAKLSRTQPLRDDFFVLEDDPALARAQRWGWEGVGRHVRLIKEECGKIPSELVLTCAPIAAQIYGRASYDRHLFRGRPTDADQAHVRSMATALGVEYVDLAGPLRKAGRGLYFRRDGHWTSKGHRVVAGALYEALQADTRSRKCLVGEPRG